jgi:zinc transport system ATP-binding protein
MNPQIEAQGVSVSLGGANVLKDVTFELGEGQFLAVLGGNGSGKTTLLRVLLGLLPISAGQVQISAGSVAYMPQRLPNIGSVPVSVREFASAGAVRGIQASVKSANVQWALETVGIWPLRRRSVDSLSGGQQRLTMFARALVNRANLIMLDEPSAGVDAEHQHELVACLRSLLAQNASIIYVTHELGLVEPLVDKVLVLDRDETTSVAYLGALPLPKGIRADVHHHDDVASHGLGANLGVSHADLSPAIKS